MSYRIRWPSGAFRPLVRGGAILVLVAGAAALLRADVVASTLAGAVILVGVAAARRRRAGMVRAAVFAVAVLAGTGAVAVALALPSYSGRPTPLLIPASSLPAPAAHNARPTREVLGFVDTAEDDSAGGLVRDGGQLTTVAATSAQLGATPGTLDAAESADALVHAHAAGASALAIVSNDTDSERGFDPDRATAMLADPAAEDRAARRIADLTAGWDGVVLDVEGLPASARAEYTAFVGAVRHAIGSRRLIVTVPAAPDINDDQLAAFDLPAIAGIADTVAWMAYDEHDPTSAPGPVAELHWVRDSIATALRFVPPGKLLLGVAGYGYLWDPAGHARELTYRDLQQVRATPGARTTFDAVAGETRVVLADGSVAWFSDARSIAVHAALVDADHLAGVALWRIGGQDPGALAGLPFPTSRGAVPGPGDRPVNHVRARGLVALTFDDGPDPQWTPQILAVLRREHVPATFFCVGEEVENEPELVRQEIADGNTVGNHTYSHPHLGSVPEWRIRYELWRGSAAIEEATGYQPTLFRSPYGDGDRVATQVGTGPIAKVVREDGLHPVDWQVDTLDYTNPGVDQIVRNATSKVSSSSILLLHDGGGNRAQTVAALPRIIERLRAMGYVFAGADALDGSIGYPYRVRQGLPDQAAGLATVAALRLWNGAGLVIAALLGLGIVVTVLRFAVGVPTSVAHAVRGARRRRRHGPAEVPEGLRVAVLIPAYNEANVIAKTLVSLAACDPPPHEVIVVDDGSTDGTAAAARDAGLAGLRVIQQSNGGKAAALNTGVAASESEIIVVVDADTVVTPRLVAEIAAPFADPAVGAVAGNVKVGNRRRLLPALQALEYVVSLNVDRRAQDVLGVITVVPGAAGAFRRAALLDVGGYPADTMVEDADLTQALLRGRWRIRYAPRAVTYTEAPQALRDVVRQRRRWSYGTVQVAAKHSPALLDPHSGRAGMVGLPWLLATQVLLPTVGPMADLWLVSRIVSGHWGVAGISVAVAIAADLALAVVAVILDGESLFMIGLSPALRLLWRPLQLIVLARAVASWFNGRTETWDKLTRHASVRVLRESRA